MSETKDSQRADGRDRIRRLAIDFFNDLHSASDVARHVHPHCTFQCQSWPLPEGEDTFFDYVKSLRTFMSEEGPFDDYRAHIISVTTSETRATVLGRFHGKYARQLIPGVPVDDPPRSCEGHMAYVLTVKRDTQTLKFSVTDVYMVFDPAGSYASLGFVYPPPVVGDIEVKSDGTRVVKSTEESKAPTPSAERGDPPASNTSNADSTTTTTTTTTDHNNNDNNSSKSEQPDPTSTSVAPPTTGSDGGDQPQGSPSKQSATSLEEFPARHTSETSDPPSHSARQDLFSSRMDTERAESGDADGDEAKQEV